MNVSFDRFRFIGAGILFLLLSSSVLAQDFEITGVITDSVQTPLSAATIYASSVKDSTVINYTISEDDGKFSLEGKTKQDQIDFYISYTGFAPYHKRLDITQSVGVIDLGTLRLKEASNTLGEVLIEGTAPPIVLKKDTLEFNVDSYQTKEDATLEDLLKKLPGVTVDNDGTIKVNGKDITKIKINGKDFFANDPKIATKNLPKDLIEKVQVVDSKTNAQEFTGKESDSDDKMINLVIKEENNKGFFARMTAGGGTDDRFSINGIANYFKGDMRLSVLGSSNNVNSIGFSFDEVYDAMGRSAFSIMNMGGNNGITKSDAAGANFVNSWNDDKMELNANYFFNRASTHTKTETQRENILPERRYFNHSINTSKQVNNNHRGDVRFEYEPDTMTRISIRPHITANNGFSQSDAFTESTEVDGTMINNSTSENHSEVRGVDFSNRFDITRKFGTKGGYVELGFDNQNSTQDQTRSNYTSRNIYDDLGVLESNEVQDQLIDEETTSNEYTIDAEARIPFSEEWKLDLEYEFTTSKNHNKRLIYETDDVSGIYNQLNDSLSSDFTSKTLRHRPSIGLVYEGEDLRISILGGLESVRMKNTEQFSDTHFDNTFNNMFARFYARYKIDRMKSVSLRYRNSRNIPSMMQLQPVTNRLNPLNIVTGNPNLTPSLSNNFSLNFYNFNFKTHYGMYVYMGGNYNTDDVVARTTTDENLVRTTTYTNIDGNYNFYGGLGVHKEFKFSEKESLKPRIGVRASIRKNNGYSNGVKYHSNTFSVSPRLSLEYDVTDVINIEPSYNISFNEAKYSLNSTRNQSYVNHDLRLRITSYWPENFIFGNDITYTHLGQTAPGFDSDYVLWNMSLGYKLWGGDGIVKVKVFDLLNQNVSTRRYTGEDYIQDMSSLVLKRYAMLSFTYKISKFGGKGKRNRMHFRMD